MPAVHATAVELLCEACGADVVLSLTPREVLAGWLGSHRLPVVMAVQVVIEGTGLEWWRRI